MAQKNTTTEPKKKYRYVKEEIVTFTKKQQVGRVLFFIVGLAFVALSIEPIVTAFKELVKLGFDGSTASYYYFFKIISGFASILLFAVTCFVAAIKAKLTFKYVIYFIAMIALVIIGTVLFCVSKQAVTPYAIFLLIMRYLLPIEYIIAFSLLFIKKKQ